MLLIDDNTVDQSHKSARAKNRHFFRFIDPADKQESNVHNQVSAFLTGKHYL
jgi:hypothetical protein